MNTDLTAARRSIRRYNTGTHAQRAVWRSHYQALLMAAGVSLDDASYEAGCGDTWDGMDTPSMAAKAYSMHRA